jgi:ankyrin repeat protein
MKSFVDAARKNKMDIVEYLLAEGADADAETTDANKFTPLMWTASRGHVSTAELLLRSGASLDAEDKVQDENYYNVLHSLIFI